jgi:hypothetical protein
MDITIHQVSNITVETRRWDLPHGKYDSHKLAVTTKRWDGTERVEEIVIYPSSENEDKLRRAFEAFNAVMAEADQLEQVAAE